MVGEPLEGRLELCYEALRYIGILRGEVAGVLERVGFGLRP